jgi:8-oxo-dGTP pyrophosphatase MutT (NUDIX family)
MKTVHKVRAMVLDRKGRAYAIVADAPHVLQLPGGSRKADECPIMAIRREIKEELGYKIQIIGHVTTIKVKRNGTNEITTCYVVMITGGKGKPKLTGREAARGLRVCRYPSPKALRKALRKREKAYGRSAVARDHVLATAALQTI